MSKKSERVGVVTLADIAAARNAVADGVKGHADALNALESLDVSDCIMPAYARVEATERVTVARQRLMLARERLAEAEGRAAQARLDSLRAKHAKLESKLNPLIETLAEQLMPLLGRPEDAIDIVREYFIAPRVVRESIVKIEKQIAGLYPKIKQWEGVRQIAADRKKREEQSAVYEAFTGGAA